MNCYNMYILSLLNLIIKLHVIYYTLKYSTYNKFNYDKLNVLILIFYLQTNLEILQL